MRPSLVRRLLLLLSLGQLLALVLAGWLAVDTLLLRERPAVPRRENRQVEYTTPPASSSPSELADLAPLWERDLNQQLFERPSRPEPKVQPAPPPKPVALPQLLATFVERDRRWGLFVTLEGKARVHPAGQRVDGFQIVAIEQGSARLRRDQHEYQLHIPERPASDSRRQPRRG